jgi:hypothetical protein
MRVPIVEFIACAMVSIPATAQNAPEKSAGKRTTLTLSGCVQRSATASNEFTFASDDNAAGTYRLSGLNVRDYVGQRVEIVGTRPKLVVKGGLLPSPNVAGQAGAMDPSRAATAAASGPTAASAPLPEFRVRSIKPIAGTCLP